MLLDSEVENHNICRGSSPHLQGFCVERRAGHHRVVWAFLMPGMNVTLDMHKALSTLAFDLPYHMLWTTSWHLPHWLVKMGSCAENEVFSRCRSWRLSCVGGYVQGIVPPHVLVALWYERLMCGSFVTVQGFFSL